MVVLDGHNMMGTGPNQYLQPDYLSPLPTTLDAKKSPLALLAQTCSQIGADSPNTKSLLPSLDGSKRKSSTSSSESSSLNLTNSSESHYNSSSSTAGKSQDKDRERDCASRPRSGGSGTPGSSTTKSGTGKSSPAFKPYEAAFASGTTSTSKREESARKSPLESPLQFQIQNQDKPKTPSQKRPASSSPNPDHPLSNSSSSSSAKQPRKSPTSSSGDKKSGSISSDDGKSSPRSTNNNNNEQGASPIIRSGLEVLQGNGLGKEFKGNPSALSSLSALASHYPPGFDPTNPAMRPPFFAPPSHPFLGGGYPPSGLSGNGMPPYVSYTRVKTPSGAETIVPVCKDPYCSGCSLSMPGLMANAAAMAAAAGFPGFLSAPPGAGGVCPAGCLQCDHQKFSISLPPFMAPPPGFVPPTSAAASYQSSLLSQHAQAAAAAAQQQQQHSQRPYVCNWIVGESYCGKRFPSSEELLQHLRTHTNMSTSEASNLASMSSPASLYSNALLSSSMSAAAAAAAMHRTYPTPPLSPLSAARYNPYAAASLAAAGKPGGGFGVPTSLSSLVPHPQSLANYYSNLSPYAMYGQRIGPPVHP